MKKLLTVIAIGLLPLTFAVPAQADNCTISTPVASVCLPPLPGVPSVPNPVPPVQSPPVQNPVPAPVVPAPIPSPVIPAPHQAPAMPSPAPHPSAPAPGKVVAPQKSVTPIPKTETKPTTCPVPSKPIVKTKTRTITIAQVAAVSIAALILGPLIALVVMYIMYRLGRREGENSVNDFMAELISLTTKKS